MLRRKKNIEELPGPNKKLTKSFKNFFKRNKIEKIIVKQGAIEIIYSKKPPAFIRIDPEEKIPVQGSNIKINENLINRNVIYIGYYGCYEDPVSETPFFQISGNEYIEITGKNLKIYHISIDNRSLLEKSLEKSTEPIEKTNEFLFEKLKLGDIFWELLVFVFLIGLNYRLGSPIDWRFLGLMTIITLVLEFMRIRGVAESEEGIYELTEEEYFEEESVFPLGIALFFLLVGLCIAFFFPNPWILKVYGAIIILILLIWNGKKIILFFSPLFTKKILIGGIIILVSYILLIFFLPKTIPNILLILIYSFFNLSVFFNSPSGRLCFGILLIGYMFVLYPILNAWIPIISAKVASTATTMGINYHVTQNESFFSYLMRHANETWLILTNPQEYYKEQFLKESGKREKGVSSMAVILNKVSVLPINAFPSTKDDNETTTLMLSFSNEGDQKATDIIYGVDLGKSAIEKGAAIENSTNYLEGVRAIDYVPELIPGERMLESFQILTPFCSGTYSGMAFLQYQYPVHAYLNLEFMDKSYYMELLKRKIITGTEKAISYCSAGPIKLTITTNKFQPIPVDINQKQLTMTFYITLQNTQSGHAMLRNLTLFLPKPVKIKKDNGYVCNYFKEANAPHSDYLILTLDEAKFKKSGKLCLNPHQMQVFTCTVTFQFDKQHPMPIKILTVKVNATYIYRYYKGFSFNVINTPELKFKKGGCTAILHDSTIQKIIKTRQNPENSKGKKNKAEDKVCGSDNTHCYYYQDYNSHEDILVLGYPDINKNAEKIKKHILDAIFNSLIQQNPFKLVIILFSPKCNESVIIRNEDILEHKESFLKGKNTKNSKEIAFLKSSEIILNEEPLQISPKYIYTLTFTPVKGKCGIFNLYIISTDQKPFKGAVCDLGQGSPCVDNSQCAPGFSCLSIYDYLAYKGSENPDNVYHLLFQRFSVYPYAFDEVYLKLENYLPSELHYPSTVYNFIVQNKILFLCIMLNQKDIFNAKKYFDCKDVINNFKSNLNKNGETDITTKNNFWSNVFQIYSQIYSGKNALVKVYFPKNGGKPTTILLPAGVCRVQSCLKDAQGKEKIYPTAKPNCECHQSFKTESLGNNQLKCMDVCKEKILKLNDLPCVCEYLSKSGTTSKESNSKNSPPQKYLDFKDYFQKFYILPTFLVIKKPSSDSVTYANPDKNGNYICDQNHLSNVVYACCLVKYNAEDGLHLKPVELALSCKKKEITKTVNQDGTTKTVTETYYYWTLSSETLISSNNEKLSYIDTCSSESSTSGICVDNDEVLKEGEGGSYVTTLSSDKICQNLIKKEYLFTGTSS